MSHTRLGLEILFFIGDGQVCGMWFSSFCLRVDLVGWDYERDKGFYGFLDVHKLILASSSGRSYE